MTTTRFFLFAMIACQCDFSLRALPAAVQVQVQGYTLPFAVRSTSKRIFYSPRFLTAPSNGETPIWDDDYLESIKNDRPKLEDFIKRTDEMLTNARQEANIDDIEKYSKFTGRAGGYLKKDLKEVDTSVETLSACEGSLY